MSEIPSFLEINPNTRTYWIDFLRQDGILLAEIYHKRAKLYDLFTSKPGQEAVIDRYPIQTHAQRKTQLNAHKNGSIAILNDVSRVRKTKIFNEKFYADGVLQENVLRETFIQYYKERRKKSYIESPQSFLNSLYVGVEYTLYKSPEDREAITDMPKLLSVEILHTLLEGHYSHTLIQEYVSNIYTNYDTLKDTIVNEQATVNYLLKILDNESKFEWLNTIADSEIARTVVANSEIYKESELLSEIQYQCIVLLGSDSSHILEYYQSPKPISGNIATIFCDGIGKKDTMSEYTKHHFHKIILDTEKLKNTINSLQSVSDHNTFVSVEQMLFRSIFRAAYYNEHLVKSLSNYAHPSWKLLKQHMNENEIKTLRSKIRIFAIKITDFERKSFMSEGGTLHGTHKRLRREIVQKATDRKYFKKLIQTDRVKDVLLASSQELHLVSVALIAKILNNDMSLDELGVITSPEVNLQNEVFISLYSLYTIVEKKYRTIEPEYMDFDFIFSSIVDKYLKCEAFLIMCLINDKIAAYLTTSSKYGIEGHDHSVRGFDDNEWYWMQSLVCRINGIIPAGSYVLEDTTPPENINHLVHIAMRYALKKSTNTGKISDFHQKIRVMNNGVLIHGLPLLLQVFYEWKMIFNVSDTFIECMNEYILLQQSPVQKDLQAVRSKCKVQLRKQYKSALSKSERNDISDIFYGVDETLTSKLHSCEDIETPEDIDHLEVKEIDEILIAGGMHGLVENNTGVIASLVQHYESENEKIMKNLLEEYMALQSDNTEQKFILKKKIVGEIVAHSCYNYSIMSDFISLLETYELSLFESAEHSRDFYSNALSQTEGKKTLVDALVFNQQYGEDLDSKFTKQYHKSPQGKRSKLDTNYLQEVKEATAGSTNKIQRAKHTIADTLLNSLTLPTFDTLVTQLGANTLTPKMISRLSSMYHDNILAHQRVSAKQIAYDIKQHVIENSLGGIGIDPLLDTSFGYASDIKKDLIKCIGKYSHKAKNDLRYGILLELIQTLCSEYKDSPLATTSQGLQNTDNNYLIMKAIQESDISLDVWLGLESVSFEQEQLPEVKISTLIAQYQNTALDELKSLEGVLTTTEYKELCEYISSDTITLSNVSSAIDLCRKKYDESSTDQDKALLGGYIYGYQAFKKLFEADTEIAPSLNLGASLSNRTLYIDHGRRSSSCISYTTDSLGTGNMRGSQILFKADLGNNILELHDESQSVDSPNRVVGAIRLTLRADNEGTTALVGDTVDINQKYGANRTYGITKYLVQQLQILGTKLKVDKVLLGSRYTSRGIVREFPAIGSTVKDKKQQSYWPKIGGNVCDIRNKKGKLIEEGRPYFEYNIGDMIDITP